MVFAVNDSLTYNIKEEYSINQATANTQYLNFYFFRVRMLNKMTNKYVKMSLQLYQVDYKSYLLDFKSLSEESEEGEEESSSCQTTITSGSLPTTSRDSPGASLTSAAEAALLAQPQSHHTLEFFEMCAALIIQLAR